MRLPHEWPTLSKPVKLPVHGKWEHNSVMPWMWCVLHCNVQTPPHFDFLNFHVDVQHVHRKENVHLTARQDFEVAEQAFIYGMFLSRIPAR